MKPYLVIIPPAIENLILDQALFISNDSIERAILWKGRLLQEILLIGEEPHRFPVDPAKSREFGKPVRKLTFERTILVFYSINETDVTVLLVDLRHGARRRRK